MVDFLVDFLFEKIDCFDLPVMFPGFDAVEGADAGLILVADERGEGEILYLCVALDVADRWVSGVTVATDFEVFGVTRGDCIAVDFVDGTSLLPVFAGADAAFRGFTCEVRSGGVVVLVVVVGLDLGDFPPVTGVLVVCLTVWG